MRHALTPSDIVRVYLSKGLMKHESPFQMSCSELVSDKVLKMNDIIALVSKSNDSKFQSEFLILEIFSRLLFL